MSTKNRKGVMLVNIFFQIFFQVFKIRVECSFKVPIEDRACLRDQRLKKGLKGLLQMAFVHRVAVKRALRSLASFPRSTVDFSSFPCTSIQSSTDTDSASVHSEESFIKQYVAITASDTLIMQSY